MIYDMWLVLTAIEFLVLTVLRGVMLACLWNWFVVAAFGLPAMGYVHAMGIGMLVNVLKFDAGEAKAKLEEERAKGGFPVQADTTTWKFVVNLGFALVFGLTLLEGYILHLL